jgi:hypothetical protein
MSSNKYPVLILLPTVIAIPKITIPAFSISKHSSALSWLRFVRKPYLETATFAGFESAFDTPLSNLLAVRAEIRRGFLYRVLTKIHDFRLSNGLRYLRGDSP